MKFILILLFFLVLIYLFYNKSARIGNWSHLYGGMQYDPEEFYKHIEEFLIGHEVPEITTARITITEEGVLSYQRLYLEVTRGDYIFHICAAPWGTDFFFSWWLKYRTNNFQLLQAKFSVGSQEEAYYKLDTDTMFRTSVHQAVLSAIDKLTAAKGARALTELERKPDLRSFIK